MKTNVAIFTCILAFVISGKSSRAGMIVGNLDQPLAQSNPLTSSIFAAQQFKTGNQAFTLDSIDVVLDNVTAGNWVGFASLVTGSGDRGINSDDSLATFLFTSRSIGIGGPFFANMKPNISNAKLEANTNYWIILGVRGTNVPSPVSWAYTLTQSVTPGSVGTLGYYAVTGNAGQSWSTDNNVTFMMQVNSASAVPEPSSLYIGLLGIVLALCFILHPRGGLLRKSEA